MRLVQAPVQKTQHQIICTGSHHRTICSGSHHRTICTGSHHRTICTGCCEHARFFVQAPVQNHSIRSYAPDRIIGPYAPDRIRSYALEARWRFVHNFGLVAYVWLFLILQILLQKTQMSIPTIPNGFHWGTTFAPGYPRRIGQAH